jgi:hypothetical protein
VTPRQFLDEICEPGVKELMSEPASLRRAWGAIIALFHFSDYLAASRGTELESVRAEFYREFPTFRQVRDIANASKHFELDKGGRKGMSARHSGVGPGAAFSDGSYYSDGTSHSDARDVVRIDFQGELVDVVHLCGQCLAYLRTKA